MEQDIINSLIVELQAKNEQIKFLEDLIKRLMENSEATNSEN